MTRWIRATAALWIALFLVGALKAQTRITSPEERFGHAIGDDYFLANYSDLASYWQALDSQSDRMSLVEIGETTEDRRRMLMAIVTSPENQKNLAHYREISEKLAHAESLDEATAQSLARSGKAVVWIDGGLHANETLGSQQLIETLYQLISRNDPETLRVLDDVILLLCSSNPDGMEWVSNQYMSEREPSRRRIPDVTARYTRYAPHDNNRDFYMSALAETRAINRVLYHEWFPQIVYDHHQTGPEGAVMFAPPFRDPFNFNLDPLVITTVDELGAAMHSRFAAEGKAGVVSRSAANYSTWWNGGLRTGPYFHNMIGLLTETIGSPTPTSIPFVPSAQLPANDRPFPIAPQAWRFRQSIDYSVTANRAVLDYASRNKDRLLFNIYTMGKRAIESGNADHWTLTPARLATVPAARNSAAAPIEDYSRLRDRADRDPRGYIIPADQADFQTATKFVNALILNGVSVERATAAFTVNRKAYPAGSWIVRTAQAFRAHILDMFEPQDHPNDLPYSGAAPTPPYDIAGWTLAYQMGVKFDRILDGFSGPFEAVHGEQRPPSGTVSTVAQTAGYLFSHQPNDAFIAVNRLLASDEAVWWLEDAFQANGKTWASGTFYVKAGPRTLEKVNGLASRYGLNFEGISRIPEAKHSELRAPNIGVWAPFRKSDAAWTLLVLDNFEFHSVAGSPSDLVGRPAVDVWVVIGGSPPSSATEQLKQFVEGGGTLLAIGDATQMAKNLGLPVADAIELPSTEFYVPGSVLSARIDNASPLAAGMGERVDIFFDNSPVFRLQPGAARRGVRPILSFDSDKPLRSGWALGQQRLKGTIAALEAPLGKGKVVLFGPDLLFRAQPHGAFKLFFNALFSRDGVTP